MSKLPTKFGQRASNVMPDDTAFGQRRLPGRVAAGNETFAAAVRTPIPQDMMRGAANLARSGIRDVMSDRQARAMRDYTSSVPTKPIEGGGKGAPDERNANLPAVICNAMTETEAGFDPRWHMVRNLPGYQQEAIRGYGRSIFGAFTSTPVEDIQMVTTLINSDTEVKLMMAWIKENGVREDLTELDGSAVFGDYKADVQKWSCNDYSFLLVRDRAGHYVYGWHRDFDASIEAEPRPCLPGR
jgi:hypothetical protein